ncbi:hypothetical protein [Nonomuraea aurantiaca]|nr:hypothetical protein [Nonomuraea aurantiaca]MCA2227393.1 hypothetical protein [Nonomuraea aurantiaca]
MNTAEIRAELRALCDRIETELNDEHRNRQDILETVATDLDDLITHLESS